MENEQIHVYSGETVPIISAVLMDHSTNQSAILQAANKPGEFILGKGGFHFLMVDGAVSLERLKFLSHRHNYPKAVIVMGSISGDFNRLLALGYISTSHQSIEVVNGELWASTNRSNYLPMGHKRRICY